MPNYTSSLPESTLTKLAQMATKLQLPKNKIIEKALNRYLLMIEKEMYTQGFRQIAGDKDWLDIVEEGMEDYNSDLLKWDEER